MLKKFRMKYTTDLDEEIDRVFGAMDVEGATSEEYPALLEALERLEKLRDGESRKPTDPNQVLAGAVSLLGIGAIVLSEHWIPFVSKAIGHVHRPKL